MKIYGWIGLLLLLVSEFCLFRKIEPIYSWFYCFAWWSYILLADNLLYKLNGRSLLTTRRHELWRMLPLSVFVWLIFEGYNFFIHNWAYDSVPPALWLRWSGYSVAFATVLPGVFITSDLLDTWIFGRPVGTMASESETLRYTPDSPVSKGFVIFGIILSVCPLVWPRFFFPFVWLGPIFVLDPLLESCGIHSLSLANASGERRKIWSLLAGGLACGLIWEFWNFWAGSKWIYTVPYFGKWKIFEMPLLGFIGFPPFALECWILYHLLTAVLDRRHSFAGRLAVWLAIGAFCLAIFAGIDHQTVLRFTDRF